MKNVGIDSVQFLLTTRHWNDETIGAYVRALVDSALQDGADVKVRDSSWCEYQNEGISLPEDETVNGYSEFSYLKEREGE